MRFVILILAMSVMSCQNSEGEAWVKPYSITISCEEYYNVKTEHGIFTNNVWNKHAARGDAWTQCLEKRPINGDTQYGWSWTWPVGRKVIYAYPQIKIGASPWAPEPKFGSSFPLKLSALKKLEISHDLEIHSNGEHNTATTAWLVKEPYKGIQANPSIIVAEVMIWTYATDGHFNPAGVKRGELTINGVTWEVWYKNEWSDQSGANNNTWISLSFRSKKSSMQSTIPALELLDYAIEENLISDDLYIADIELGNEVMSGSGITWVKEFNVVYEK